MNNKEKFFQIISEHEKTNFNKFCFIKDILWSSNEELKEKFVYRAEHLSALYSPLCSTIVFGNLKLIEFLLSDLKEINNN